MKKKKKSTVNHKTNANNKTKMLKTQSRKHNNISLHHRRKLPALSKDQDTLGVFQKGVMWKGYFNFETVETVIFVKS